MTLEEIIQNAGNLPASQITQAVNQTLTAHNSLVITAPPGAGKSTLLPLTMMKGLNLRGKILILEPRRMAARQIAERMAHILKEPVGKTVGYRIRFENKVSSETRIEVLTEGILTRMLISDATLDGIDCVVFDEFHERSLNSDLALALTRQCQEVIRPDLKIVVMSATINTQDICQKLHAPLIESEGKMFPVHIVYADKDLDRFEIPRAVAVTCLKALREQSGDILAFLPGQGDILKCEAILKEAIPTERTKTTKATIPTQTILLPQENLDDQKKRINIYPLYGNLSQEDQKRAIAPSKQDERKIVLATPIAETSITIEGVRSVIDSGYCRKLVFDARTGLSHLETVRISKDMATQRTGRAGRVAEGTCYRLWNSISEHQMEERRKPEIEEADLSSMLLDVTAFGESEVQSLPWLTPPPTGNVAKAHELLSALGAVTMDGEKHAITPLGRKMALLPCHPRISRMILSAQTPGMKSLACDIAAILEEKDPLANENETDLSLRISLLRNVRKKQSPGKWSRIANIAKEYLRLAHASEDNSEVAGEEVGLLVAHAYPERIAMSISNLGDFRLASGSHTKIETSDPNSAQKWIAIASMYSSSLQNSKVFLAAPVNIETLNDLTLQRDNISWDSKQGCVLMQQERRIGKLLIESKPIHDADKQQVVRIICDAIKKDGLSMLDWNSQVQLLQRRVALVSKWHPELNIPDLSTQHLLDTAQDWLSFYLEQGNHLLTTTTELRRLKLQEVLWASIPYELQGEIDRLAPTRIQVPSGHHIRIDYRQGSDIPVLSVRLQECFGLKKTPCVNDGKQPVLMELLSPGFKPVQLTQDLESFWQNTYFEVRKELKRRYPKHQWPENP